MDFWDMESNGDKHAYLMEGGQLHLIDYINSNLREDGTFDIGVVSDDDLHAVEKYAFVILIDDTPKTEGKVDTLADYIMSQHPVTSQSEPE